MIATGAGQGICASVTYAWAAELASSGIRVNAISPMAYSPMSRQMEAFETVLGGNVLPTNVVRYGVIRVE